MQDRGLAAALHGARRDAAAGVPARRRASRSCTSCAATARSSSTRWSSTAARRAWESLPDLYVELLTAATTFRYDRADAFVDVDPRFYAARYLRAWQLQALIAETLVERYDEDWWRNPRAGPWICSALFGEGQRELAHEQAERVAGKPLSFAPLVRAVERMLA